MDMILTGYLEEQSEILRKKIENMRITFKEVKKMNNKKMKKK